MYIETLKTKQLPLKWDLSKFNKLTAKVEIALKGNIHEKKQLVQTPLL